jgi:hypothetical protein
VDQAPAAVTAEVNAKVNVAVNTVEGVGTVVVGHKRTMNVDDVVS